MKDAHLLITTGTLSIYLPEIKICKTPYFNITVELSYRENILYSLSFSLATYLKRKLLVLNSTSTYVANEYFKTNFLNFVSVVTLEVHSNGLEIFVIFFC